jgi:hypothetical protein
MIEILLIIQRYNIQKAKLEFKRAKWKNLFHENSTLNPCEVCF